MSSGGDGEEENESEPIEGSGFRGSASQEEITSAPVQPASRLHHSDTTDNVLT